MQEHHCKYLLHSMRYFQIFCFFKIIQYKVSPQFLAAVTIAQPFNILKVFFTISIFLTRFLFFCVCDFPENKDFR